MSIWMDRTVYTLQHVIYINIMSFSKVCTFFKQLLVQNMSWVVIFLNLVLIFIYFYLFGWKSFINYLEGGVIIKRNSASVRTKDIKQPGKQDRLNTPDKISVFLLIFQEL